MLMKAIMLVSSITVLIPFAIYIMLTQRLINDLEPEIRKEIQNILYTDQELKDNTSMPVIPHFSDWRSKEGPPADFVKPFSKRHASWLKFQSSAVLERLFKDLFDSCKVVMDREDPHRLFLKWRTISRAIISGALYHGLDATLKRGSISGLEAYLQIPGFHYFLSHSGNRFEDKRRFEEYKRNFFYYGSYAGKPFFLFFDGMKALESLTNVMDPSVRKKIDKAMNDSLIKWTPDHIWPWLPLAYFSARPDGLSIGAIETYLNRVLDKKETPYMLNAAALFLFKSEPARICQFLNKLYPFAKSTTRSDLCGDKIGDQAYLYWFLIGSAKTFCSNVGAVAVETYNIERNEFHPIGFDSMAVIWKYAERYQKKRVSVFHDDENRFYLLVKSMSSHTVDEFLVDIEVLHFIQGHSFMDF